MTTPTVPSDALGVSLDETVVEELVPPGARRQKKPRGDRPLLEVKGLYTSFQTRHGLVRAVDGIDFHVDRGEIMGLVGESGCGKSVTSLSIMRLVANPGRIEAGEVLFDGRDLLKISNEEMRRSAVTASRWCSSSRPRRSTRWRRPASRSRRCSRSIGT